MRRLFYSLTAAATSGLAASAAAPAITNIANFPSLSVAYTNYASQARVTNELRVGSSGADLTISAAGALAIFNAAGSFVFTNATLYAGQYPLPGLSMNIPPTLYHGDFAQTNLYLTNLPSGNTDLYTVPSGMRFFPFRIAGGTTNQTVAAIMQAKTNGNYYPLRNSVSLVTNGVSQLDTLIVLEGSESLSVNTDKAGVSLVVTGYLFTNTIPFYTARNYALPSGATTFYTVPAGRKLGGVTPPGQQAYPIMVYLNRTGVTPVINIDVVAAAGSLLRMASLNLATGSSTSPTVPLLQAGDSIRLTSDSAAAGQILYMTLVEQ